MSADVDITQLIKSVYSTSMQSPILAEKKQIEFLVDYPEWKLVIHADPLRLT